MSTDRDAPEEQEANDRTKKSRRVMIEESHDHLVISVRWFDGWILSVLLASFAFLTLLIVSSLLRLGQEGSLGGVGMLIAILVALPLLYISACYWWNRTRIDITAKTVCVSCSPIPCVWPQRRTLETRDLSQMFVKWEHRGSDGGHFSTLHLYALLTTGQTIELLEFKGPRELLAIEEKIERFLGIDDRRVQGEFDSLDLI